MKTYRCWESGIFRVIEIRKRSANYAVIREVEQLVIDLFPAALVSGAIKIGIKQRYFEVNLNDDLSFHSFVL